MRVGQTVWYVKGRTAREAVVAAVTGSGLSGYKTLDLDVSGKHVAGVPHARDSDGSGHWSSEREHAAPTKKARTAPTPAVPESSDEGHATAGGGSQE